MPDFTDAHALVVGMPHHRGAGVGGVRRGVVGRSVVDDEDLVPGAGLAQRAHDLADRGAFVERGDDDGKIDLVAGHAREFYREPSLIRSTPQLA
jgi:hypothetical protein